MTPTKSIFIPQKTRNEGINSKIIDKAARTAVLTIKYAFECRLSKMELPSLKRKDGISIYE